MGHFSHAFAPRIPAVGFCEEKARLMDEFLDAIHELGTLQSERARAVIDGASDSARFDSMIREADERKDRVKNACLAHVARHHC
jgi:hypothetical protein